MKDVTYKELTDLVYDLTGIMPHTKQYVVNQLASLFGVEKTKATDRAVDVAVQATLDRTYADTGSAQAIITALVKNTDLLIALVLESDPVSDYTYRDGDSDLCILVPRDVEDGRDG